MPLMGEEVNAQLPKDRPAKARVGQQRKQEKRREMLHERGLRLQY
jgi:hypothetical protein